MIVINTIMIVFSDKLRRISAQIINWMVSKRSVQSSFTNVIHLDLNNTNVRLK